MTTWAERAEAREDFERDMSQWHLDHAQEENDMPRSYPVRLTQMSENQKMNRIIDLENALQQTNERIAAAVAEAVKAEREAIKRDIIDPYVYTLKYGGDRTQADLRDIASEIETLMSARNGAK